jgi:glycosyltransferase involved in cell wall biosynthesis
MIRNILDYWVIKKNRSFDPIYYLSNYPDVRRADVDPLWHFVTNGWKEGRDPSADFDTTVYLNENSDVKQANINPFSHYLKYGRYEGRNIGRNNKSTLSISNLSGANNYRGLLRRIYEILHALYAKLPLPIRIKIKKILKANNVKNIINFHPAQSEYENYAYPNRSKSTEKFFSFLSDNYNDRQKIEYIFFLPLFSTGGAEIVALNFIHLILQKKKDISILLIITDKNKMDPRSTLPKQLICLNLDEFLGSDDLILKKVFIYDVINAIRPSIIHNINSSVFWILLSEQGKHIKEISKVFANIFCIQKDQNNSREGYAEYYLPHNMYLLDGLFSDNNKFISEAIETYNLQDFANKMFSIYTPIDNILEDNDQYNQENKIEEYKTSNSLQSRGLWMGRLDAQKRWKLFIELVRSCDFFDFDMYGQSVTDDMPIFIESLPNLHFKGAFSSFSKVLQNQKYDAFIFTSIYEGMPTTLLNIALWQIPIIAPSVGGISEIINSDTGYLLPEAPTIVDYLSALRSIQERPYDAQTRAGNLRQMILKKFNWRDFSKTVLKIPGYLDLKK